MSKYKEPPVVANINEYVEAAESCSLHSGNE